MREPRNESSFSSNSYQESFSEVSYVSVDRLVAVSCYMNIRWSFRAFALLARFPDYDPAPHRATPIAPASRDVRIIANSDSRPQHNIQLTHKFVSGEARSVVAAEPQRLQVQWREFAGPRGTMHKSGDLCAQVGGFVYTSRGICAHKVGDLCVVPLYRHRLYP